MDLGARVTATDDQLRAGVEAADVIALLPAVAHLTGDLSVLRDELRPDPLLMMQPDNGFTAEQLAMARSIALDALVAHRDAGAPREELALEGADHRAPSWTKATIAPDQPWRVAVIGAGMSGLLAAHRLRQAGVDVTILEKDSDVGGTWYENTYPGCRVDVPNHFYSYSFMQSSEWPQFFSTQPALLDYFRRCAKELGLQPLIRFDTEVLEARFDDAAQCWQVTTRAADGTEATDTYEMVVSAVGQLNRPKMPDIPGIESFAGPSFHSARWDPTVDLTGKHVAVIGTGASSTQLIPEITPVVDELLVFQRTPPWLAPTPNYHDDLPAALRWLMEWTPDYARWDRLVQFWRMHEG